MKKRKASLSFIITILVVGLVTLFLLWSTLFFLSLYVSSMKQAAQTSSEQAVTQASNAISNYIGDMQEIMSLIEQRMTRNEGNTDQTLETLCNVRSDLVAVYIYDEQGTLVDSHTGEHTLKEHYLKDLSYIPLDSQILKIGKCSDFKNFSLYLTFGITGLLANFYVCVSV